jgi:hypothetical protein
VAQVAASKDGGHRGVLQARRLHESVRRAGRRGLEVLDPAERAQVNARRPVVGAQPPQRALREGRDPRVQPVRAHVQRLRQQPVERGRAERLEPLERRPEPAVVLGVRFLQLPPLVEKLPERGRAGERGHPPFQHVRSSQCRRRRLEIDHLRLRAHRYRCLLEAGDEPERGRGVRRQRGVAQQQVQKRLRRAARELLIADLRRARRTQPLDVVRRERIGFRKWPGLHARRGQLVRVTHEEHVERARRPRHSQSLERRTDDRVARHRVVAESREALPRPPVAEVVPAEDGPPGNLETRPVHPEDLEQSAVGIAARLHVRHTRGGRLPEQVAQLAQQVQRGRLARRFTRLAGFQHQTVQRGDRQQAVRLVADAQRGQRAAAANVVDEVSPERVDLRPAERGRHHLLEVVAPCRVPECRVHVRCVRLLRQSGIRHVREDRRVQAQRRRSRSAVRAIAGNDERVATLDREAAFERLVRPVERRPFLARVVRRRALPHEAEAARVVVTVEQAGEPVDRFARIGARLHADSEQQVDAQVRIGADRHAHTHPDALRFIEVVHPLQCGIDCGLAIRRIGDVRVGFRSDRQRIGHRLSPDREHALAAAVAEHDEAVGQRRRLRRTRPRLRVHRRFRKRRCVTADVTTAVTVHLVAAVAVAIARFVRRHHPCDPRGPFGAQPAGQPGPRGQPRGLAVFLGRVVGRPCRLPERPTQLDFLFGQLRLVRLDVDVVRVDAHQQVGAFRGDAEPGLEAHRQKRNGLTGLEPAEQVGGVFRCDEPAEQIIRARPARGQPFGDSCEVLLRFTDLSFDPFGLVEPAAAAVSRKASAQRREVGVAANDLRFQLGDLLPRLAQFPADRVSFHRSPLRAACRRRGSPRGPASAA